MAPRPKLAALTGLRYVAALMVLLTHMTGPFSGTWKKYTYDLYGIGMPLFFVLSGFLMAYNYTTGFQAQYRRTLRNYLAARFARIYPVYLLAFLISFSFIGGFFHELREHPTRTATVLSLVLTGTQSWVHGAGLDDGPGPRAVLREPFLPIAWSVSVEVFFYAMFPLVVLPIARLASGGRRAIAAGVLVYASWLTVDWFWGNALLARGDVLLRGWWCYLSPYARFGEFLLGALAGRYFLENSLTPVSRREKWIGGFLLAAAVVILFRLNHVLMSKPLNFSWATQLRLLMLPNILFAPLIGLIVYCLARISSPLQWLLGSRPLVVLGESSYCLYLMHPMFIALFHPRRAGEVDMTQTAIVVYNNLAMVICMHLFCLGMWRYWEEPARRAIRRLLEAPPTSSAKAAGQVSAELPRMAA